jgi:DNA polymerase III subunit beta
MKTDVLQENLLKALTKTGRIISTKPQLPVVQNVLLETKEERLRLAATNLETTENVWVGAKIEKVGGLCVSSRLLTEFVASLPKETVHLMVQEGSLHISCGGFRAVLPGVATSEFPPVSELAGKKAIKTDKETMIGALHDVMFSAASDEGRPILTGVRFIQENEETILAATDGYRLSVKRIHLSTKEPLDFIVPARAISEVVKISLEEKEEKSITIEKTNDGQLGFVVGDTEVYTRLIDGEYPNFEKIIPKTHQTRLLLDKEVLYQAVRSASVFARDSANIIRFHIENQELVVSANTPQVGENHVTIDAKVDGEGGDIAFNSRFLLDYLSNFQGSELLFEMTGSLNPGVFKPVKDESYLHIIMPVRVQG